MSLRSTYSHVVYPSAIFSLNKPEILVYERFAYEAMHLAHQVVNAANLPDSLMVTFEPNEALGALPYTLNAYVSRRLDEEGRLIGFTVGTTPFTPAVMQAICHTVGLPLCNYDTCESWFSDPSKLRGALQSIEIHLAESIDRCGRDGLGSALGTFLNSTGYNIWNMNESAMLFNSMASFLVNHELAHVYVRALTRNERRLSDDECRAFEFVEDLVATTWLYTRLVRTTPDTPEYRELFGHTSFSESTRENARAVLNTQLLIVLFFSLRSAMASGSLATDGSRRFHPHGLLRQILQMAHFSNLVLSNQKAHFSDEHESFLDETWESNLDLLCGAEVVLKSDLEAITDDVHDADLRTAAALIEEFQIPELKPLQPFLDSMVAPRTGE